MAEIYVKSSSPIYHQVFWNGQASNVDSLYPVVKIYDITEDPAINPAISPNTLLATVTAIADETNTGKYFINVPYQYTDRNRTLKAVWEYTVGGTLVSKEDLVFIVTPYTDLTQSSNELGLSMESSDPNFVTYADLKMAEKYARKIIENHTGQQFYLYDDVLVTYGSDSDILPLRQKINSLHEIYGNDMLLIDELNNVNNIGYDLSISESGFGLKMDRSQTIDNTVYIANGMVPPSIHSSNGFFNSNTAYRVQGRFGWDRVPDDIELACIELMKEYFAKDRTWSNKYIKSIQTFDWQFEYSGEAYSGTGNLYADKLLAPYVISTMVVF